MSLFEKKEKKELDVEGMTCGHCVKRVTEALRSVDGVKKAEVSIESGKAEVTLEAGEVDDETLARAVEEAGYRATPRKGD